MPSTYSTNLKLELIGTGDQSGTWGSFSLGEPAVISQKHPVDLAEVKLIPSSVTLTAKEGSYMVGKLTNLQDLPVDRLYGRFLWVDKNQTTDGSPATVGGAIFNNSLGGTIDEFAFTDLGITAHVASFQQFGVLYTGLSAQTELTITARWIIEYFPLPTDNVLTPLSKPAASFNAESLELLSKAFQELPVGTSVFNNSTGSWFSGIMNAVKAASPLVQHIPVLGDVVKAGVGLYDSLNRAAKPEATTNIVSKVKEVLPERVTRKTKKERRAARAKAKSASKEGKLEITVPDSNLG